MIRKPMTLMSDSRQGRHGALSRNIRISIILSRASVWERRVRVPLTLFVHVRLGMSVGRRCEEGSDIMQGNYCQFGWFGSGSADVSTDGCR